MDCFVRLHMLPLRDQVLLRAGHAQEENTSWCQRQPDDPGHGDDGVITPALDVSVLPYSLGDCCHLPRMFHSEVCIRHILFTGQVVCADIRWR